MARAQASNIRRFIASHSMSFLFKVGFKVDFSNNMIFFRGIIV